MSTQADPQVMLLGLERSVQSLQGWASQFREFGTGILFAAFAANHLVFKRGGDYASFHIDGPTTVDFDPKTGIMTITSNATAANPTNIAVDHPPPPGVANQTHALPAKATVTVYPNGNILIATP
jgi:hypothetical protein